MDRATGTGTGRPPAAPLSLVVGVGRTPVTRRDADRRALAVAGSRPA
jgi:hypothetical protein